MRAVEEFWEIKRGASSGEKDTLGLAFQLLNEVSSPFLAWLYYRDSPPSVEAVLGEIYSPSVELSVGLRRKTFIVLFLSLDGCLIICLFVNNPHESSF